VLFPASLDCAIADTAWFVNVSNHSDFQHLIAAPQSEKITNA